MLLLTELPLSAWGNRSTAEVVALTRDELDRHGISGAGGPLGHRARRVRPQQETIAGNPPAGIRGAATPRPRPERLSASAKRFAHGGLDRALPRRLPPAGCRGGAAGHGLGERVELAHRDHLALSRQRARELDLVVVDGFAVALRRGTTTGV